MVGGREAEESSRRTENSRLRPAGCCLNPARELLAFFLSLTPRFLRPELQALIVVLKNGSGFCLCSLIFDREDLDGFDADPRGQGDRLWRHSEDDTGEDCGLENGVPWGWEQRGRRGRVRNGTCTFELCSQSGRVSFLP